MPNRILRDGIIDSERINSLSPEAELFYRRLMSKVDDYGRFHGHPQLVLAACYPLQLDRVSPTNVSKWLAECAQAAVITLYEVDSKKYLEINNFGQRTRTDSKFPAPCAHHARTMRATREHPAAHARARSESESESESNAESNAETEAGAKADTAFAAIVSLDPLPLENAPFEQFCAVYRGPIEDTAWRIFGQCVNGPDELAAILENTPLWMETKAYADGFHGAIKFLRSGVWKRPPKEQPPELIGGKVQSSVMRAAQMAFGGRK